MLFMHCMHGSRLLIFLLLFLNTKEIRFLSFQLLFYFLVYDVKHTYEATFLKLNKIKYVHSDGVIFSLA